MMNYVPELSVSQFMQKTLDIITEFTRSEIGFYHFLEDDQETLSLQAWSTKTEETYCKAKGKGLHYNINSAGVWVDCVRLRKPVIHNDYTSLPDKKGLPEGHSVLIRELTVPVLRNGQISAIIGIGNKPENYDEHDVEVVTYLADFSFRILEKKQREEFLRKSTDFLEALMNFASAPIIVWDDFFRITHFSKAAEELTGLNFAEVSGKPVFSLFTENPDQEISEYIRQASTGEHWNGKELEIRNKDGELKTLIWNSSVIRSADGQSVLSTLVQGQDITERKKVEEKLEESESKFRNLFSKMTEMVVLHKLVYDESGTAADYMIYDCNEAFERITGLSKKDTVGKLASDVYKSSPPPYLKEFTETAESGVPFEYSTYYAPMDKYFLINVVSPKRGHFATITTDFTAIRQSNQTLFEKNKELENYLYIASHDLRSPLVNIQGFGARLSKQTESVKRLLRQTGTDGKAEEEITSVIEHKIPATLQYISSNVNKMDSLIKGLLNISRTGRAVMSINHIKMNELFGRILDSFDYQLKDAGAVTVVADLPDCYGDENLINQLFSNLIGNSIKYRDQERPLKITISGETRSGNSVYHIKDNGIGIADYHLEKIFDVFFRVEGLKDTKSEGIGLSIVKRIADKHKGRVNVKSAIGDGSEFIIELPNSSFSE